MKATKQLKNKADLTKNFEQLHFYVDEESKIGHPRIIDNKMPTALARRYIPNPLTLVFKTDEEDTYILRKEIDVDALAKAGLIWEHTKKVIDIFPEVEQVMSDAQVKIQKPGCSSCGKNSAKRVVINKIAEAYKNKERDISSLEEIFNKTEMGIIRGDNIAHAPGLPTGNPVRRGPRESCLDCARKHLAQAIVLIGEAHMGYPNHRWLAVGHLAEASEETLSDYPDMAEDLRSERLQLMADSNYKPMLMDFIDQLTAMDEAKIKAYEKAANARMKKPKDQI